MNFNITNHQLLRARLFILVMTALLAACGENPPLKSTPKVPTASAPAKQSPTAPNNESTTKTEPKPGSGGYYLDDGPGENAPANIDSIPSATLKTEQPYKRANKPYSALGQQYTPMTSYVPYKKQGVASWYGKRFHGKKTSTGEVYDMYAMTAAHTILPIPSYAKVTNPANGRSVIVRINDRGPFKRDRLIDLSYAAAYQLRLIKQGSGLVEVETIDTSLEALRKAPADSSIQTAATSQNILPENIPPSNTMPAAKTTAMEATPTVTPAITTAATSTLNSQFYVQAGAFKSEANGDLLQKKIQSLDLGENVGVANVYNSGLYRVKLGPYASRSEADVSAANIRRQLNIAAHVTN
ncbi:septal ring lytic transglycosylase RlpA family protein [Methylotenera sp.]|uniref:septal ring lytic transglycosylase RlpA family protein n=1 Tax=Methylotenera sp. TaxID=2051956 RepID=UPI002486E0CB|nr:septal ring lytic transglycosylase RlpA family protein [Methylotenera sp.]MDI1360763.1 septal ring lytic transglycosylase RlpA family protein [Methylotenera sp.]